MLAYKKNTNNIGHLENPCITSSVIEPHLNTIFMATSSGKKTIYRRSDNGRITTKEYAEKHPKTTEKERVNK